MFYEPNICSAKRLPTHLGAVDDDNTVFSFHDYCISTWAVVRADRLRLRRHAEDGIIGTPWRTRTHNMPAFSASSATNTVRPSPSVMDAANRAQFGWTKWAYTG